MTAGGLLCRIEYLSPGGWAHGHSGMSLLNPAKYVTKAHQNKGEYARVTVLDDRLQSTDEVYAPADMPDPCDLCGRYLHKIEGECLL